MGVKVLRMWFYCICFMVSPSPSFGSSPLKIIGPLTQERPELSLSSLIL